MAENKTILIIDDSQTIRRLVDTTLSREGYSVVIADNAELGLELAAEHLPDMILLDHQLPGTTGLDVCAQLILDDNLRAIPVVISSTLRKKAYVEYAEMDNVVDMLPKPYTEDLLLTTVSNALDTGSLIVQSQAKGTAVPEVIKALGDADLSGSFNSFSIREVLDLLNNGRKGGTLTVEGENNRYQICLGNGRVVGISATGIPADTVVDRLPESLREFAPVVNVTMGRGGTALESIVDLLNTEVLDPRLLRKLLRHQASVLLIRCFADQLKSFRFDGNKEAPSLFQRLPLDISVLALLVEGASTSKPEDLPEVSSESMFTRQPIRGQNLDRAGLTAKQALVLGQLATSKSLSEIAEAADGGLEEVRAILYGFELAQLVECQDATEVNTTTEVILYETELPLANKINKAFAQIDRFHLTVVNDATAARLLARRTSPQLIVADARDEAVFKELRSSITGNQIRWIATTNNEGRIEDTDLQLTRPYSAMELLDALEEACGQAGSRKADMASEDLLVGAE